MAVNYGTMKVVALRLRSGTILLLKSKPAQMRETRDVSVMCTPPLRLLRTSFIRQLKTMVGLGCVFKILHYRMIGDPVGISSGTGFRG